LSKTKGVGRDFVEGLEQCGKPATKSPLCNITSNQPTAYRKQC
jgi:hypothetical protein